MASTAFAAPSPARLGAAKKDTPVKFAAHSKNAGKVRLAGAGGAGNGMAADRATNVHRAPPRPPAVPLPQMDRFIPNRNASNLDAANYAVSRDSRDVENLSATAALESPSKARAHPGGGPGRWAGRRVR